MDSYSKIQHSFRMVRDGREKKKEPANPYMDMFLAVDISSYSEVLYSKGLGLVHCVGVGVWLGDYGVGVTRGMVDGFLMANGQPIDVIQGWIDQLPSVISLSSPQSFLASSLITVAAIVLL